jgi:monoamine oxidase
MPGRSLNDVRVAVVGAGLAGLTAAFELSRRGATVQVVEARERIGGRVWTIRDPSDGVHVEAGGEFIDKEHSAVRQLAARLKLPLVQVAKSGFGLALGVEGALRVSSGQQAVWRALARVLRSPLAAYKKSGCDWNSTAAATIAKTSLADALDSADVTPDIRAAAEALRGFYLADPDRLSSLVLIDQLIAGGNPGDATMYRVQGGNDRLVDALAGHLRGGVSLRQAVRAVSQHARGVRLSIESAAGEISELEAQYAVIALPAPHAVSCHFAPPMPAHQLQALKSLRSGAATKLSLRFEDPWWRRKGRPNAFGSNLAIGAIWETAEEQDAAVLTCLAGASASTALQTLFEAEGVDGLVAQLSWLGRPTPAKLIGPPVCWEKEPWSRGGYAIVTPEFDPRLAAALASSHGRLVFAGEHTSRRWQGFMNGAVESGLRAANEIDVMEELRAA